uniref:Uncharacterized protein n=1 Tax=Anguilla anguilla TaxID=7936 RepID=A0A0E9W648_ANGAN
MLSVAKNKNTTGIQRMHTLSDLQKRCLGSWKQ